MHSRDLSATKYGRSQGQGPVWRSSRLQFSLLVAFIHSEVKHWPPTSVQPAARARPAWSPRQLGPLAEWAPGLRSTLLEKSQELLLVKGTGGWDDYFCFSERFEHESMFAKDEGPGQISRWEMNVSGDREEVGKAESVWGLRSYCLADELLSRPVTPQGVMKINDIFGSRAGRLF